MVNTQEVPDLKISCEMNTAPIHLELLTRGQEANPEKVFAREEFRFIKMLDSKIEKGGVYAVVVRACFIVWDEDGEVYQMPTPWFIKFMRIFDGRALPPENNSYLVKAIMKELIPLIGTKIPAALYHGDKLLLGKGSELDPYALFEEIYPLLGDGKLRWDEQYVHVGGPSYPQVDGIRKAEEYANRMG